MTTLPKVKPEITSTYDDDHDELAIYVDGEYFTSIMCAGEPDQHFEWFLSIFALGQKYSSALPKVNEDLEDGCYIWKFYELGEKELMIVRDGMVVDQDGAPKGFVEEYLSGQFYGPIELEGE